MDKKDEKGDTALHKAAMHGHFEVADMLLKRGAVANGTNNEGFTPFQYAVLYGRKVWSQISICLYILVSLFMSLVKIDIISANFKLVVRWIFVRNLNILYYNVNMH